MEQSSLFGDGVDIDTETPASADAAAPTDARAQAAARAAELRHELDYHAYRYYMLDAPEITDAAFDKMLVELQEIEATYPDLVTPDRIRERAVYAGNAHGTHVFHGRCHGPGRTRRVAPAYRGCARCR